MNKTRSGEINEMDDHQLIYHLLDRIEKLEEELSTHVHQYPSGTSPMRSTKPPTQYQVQEENIPTPIPGPHDRRVR